MKIEIKEVINDLNTLKLWLEQPKQSIKYGYEGYDDPFNGDHFFSENKFKVASIIVSNLRSRYKKRKSRIEKIINKLRQYYENLRFN